MTVHMTPDQLRKALGDKGRHADPEQPPQPTEGHTRGSKRLWVAIGLAVVVGFGIGSSGPPDIVEVERVITVPGPEVITEVPVPIVSALQEERLERLQARVGSLTVERNRLAEELEKAQTPINVQAIARGLGCFEDEHVVLIVGVVQLDDGQDPPVDWAHSEPAGSYGCYAADDFAERHAP